jgi:hypothetical protein
MEKGAFPFIGILEYNIKKYRNTWIKRAEFEMGIWLKKLASQEEKT